MNNLLCLSPNIILAEDFEEDTGAFITADKDDWFISNQPPEPDVKFVGILPAAMTVGNLNALYERWIQSRGGLKETFAFGEFLYRFTDFFQSYWHPKEILKNLIYDPEKLLTNKKLDCSTDDLREVLAQTFRIPGELRDLLKPQVRLMTSCWFLDEFGWKLNFFSTCMEPFFKAQMQITREAVNDITAWRDALKRLDPYCAYPDLWDCVPQIRQTHPTDTPEFFNEYLEWFGAPKALPPLAFSFEDDEEGEDDSAESALFLPEPAAIDKFLDMEITA